MITLVSRAGRFDLIIDGVVIATATTKAKAKELIQRYDFT